MNNKTTICFRRCWMKFLESKIVYESNRFQVEEATFQNETGDVLTRNHVLTKSAVVVLPITKEGKIVMVKQYRTAVGNQETLELPAGCVEKNEDYKMTGMRELQEETGYIANDLTFLLAIHPSNGYTNETVYLYAVEGLEQQTKQNLDPGEEIKVVTLNKQELLQKIYSGEIQNAATITATLFYFFND